MSKKQICYYDNNKHLKVLLITKELYERTDERAFQEGIILSKLIHDAYDWCCSKGGNYLDEGSLKLYLDQLECVRSSVSQLTFGYDPFDLLKKLN